MKKHLSLISILITIVIFFIKLKFDIVIIFRTALIGFCNIFIIITNIFSNSKRELVDTSIDIFLNFYFFLPMLLSFSISIIGARNKNRYYKIALFINILVLIYSMLPTKILLDIFRICSSILETF